MSDLDPTDPDVNAYAYLTSIVVPRPIAWVATLSAEGAGNLAPHSFFTVVCADPPIVAFTSIGRKDTLRNVLETREFTISMTTEPLMEHVNDTSAPFEHGVDEAEQVGLAMAPSVRVAPPRVAASPAALECRLHSTVDLDSSVVVLGEVVSIHVDDAVVTDRYPDFAAMAPVARLGGPLWALPGEVVSRQRPQSPEDVAPR